MTATPHARSDGELWGDQVARAAPLFKWAGGKQRFLWNHADLIPEFPGRYFEPFAGGLSILFHVARRSSVTLNSVLSDTNLRLIRCYNEVRRDWPRINEDLRYLEAGYRAATDKAAFFYARRAEHNHVSPSADAARFIFLMAAGWNGVYRTNARGEFNVPHGHLKNELRLPDEAQLAAVSTVFKHSSMRAANWESTLSGARMGDFVFFDPPYYSDSRNQLYDRSGSFGFGAQVRLADALVDLANRGVDFLLTNAAHPAVEVLYRERGLWVETIDMHRSINSKVAGRGADGELVVRPGGSQRARTARASLRLKMAVNRLAAEGQ